MNRRHFLQLSAAGLAGVSLAACTQSTVPAPAVAPAPTAVTPAPAPTSMPAVSAAVAAVTPVPYPTAEPTTLIEPGTTLRNEDSSRFFIRYYKAFPAPDRDQWRLAVGGLVDAPANVEPRRHSARTPVS